MTIDSSGRVLTPARPLFRVGMTNTIKLTLLKTMWVIITILAQVFLLVLLLDFINLGIASYFKM